MIHNAGKAVTEQLKTDGFSDRSAKAYYKEFQKVVEVANVVLQVLDCRDPLSTRCVGAQGEFRGLDQVLEE